VFINQATSFKIQTYKQTGGQKFKVSIAKKKEEKPKPGSAAAKAAESRGGLSRSASKSAEESDEDVSVLQEDLQNGSYSVWYSLPSVGKYIITVTTAGENIKGSPYSIAGTESQDI
jgi:hypothetical protein